VSNSPLAVAIQNIKRRSMSINKPLEPESILLLLLVLIAFVTRLYFLYDLSLIQYDGTYYIRYFFGEKSWGGPFPFGYPLLIQAAHLIIQDEVIAARLVSTVFGSLLVVPLFGLLKRVTDFRIAAILVLIVAIHPGLIRFSTQSLSDIPYLYFWLLGFNYYYRGKIIHAVAAESVAYFIRPEGLIFAGSFLLIYFIREKNFVKSFYGGLVILAALSIFMIHTHDRTGTWTISGKAGNLKVFYIDNWQKNEEIGGKESSFETVIDNLVNQYPKRVVVISEYIVQLTTWPLVIIGLIGFFIKPSVYWIILIQFFLTPLSGANYDLRYGLPYFLILILGVGLFISHFNALYKYRYSIILLGAFAFFMNLKYIQDKYLLTPDERFIELKEIGLKLRAGGYSKFKIMDRKPYTAFFAGSEKFVFLPYGSINNMLAKANEEAVDLIVMHAGIIRIFRPQLVPLLFVADSVVSPQLITIYNDISIRRESGIRIFKVTK